MKRSLLWSALILTALITLVWPLIPLPSAENRLAAIPTSSADFQIRPLELTDADRAFLGKAQAVHSLIAMRGGGKLMLTVIDGTHNRHAVHDPYYCFAGAGWKIVSKNSIKVPSGNALWMSLANNSQRSEALWFFDDGQHQFTSALEYWLETSSRRATLGRSGAEPVLIMLQSLPGESIDWDRVRQILLPALGFH